MPRRPDLVVSGMNAGANVGINVIYSGTVAAAIEAAFLGLPSIAISMFVRSDDRPLDFTQAAATGREAIERILKPTDCPPGQVANINVPPLTSRWGSRRRA